MRALACLTILLVIAAGALAQIKVSELPSTTTVNGTDSFLIVQAGVTKRILGSNLSVGLVGSGSTNLVNLGTVTNGTWAAAPVGLAYGGTGATNAAGARLALELGTAATNASTNFATSAQGALAATALQPGTSWTNIGGLGTAATNAETNFATSAQGALADTSVQPGDLVSDLLYQTTYFWTITGAGDASANGDFYIDESTAFERILRNEAGYFLRALFFYQAWKITTDTGVELYQTTSTGWDPAALNWDLVNGTAPLPVATRWSVDQDARTAIAARALLAGDNTFTGNNTFGPINNITLSGNGSLAVTGNASVSGVNTGDQNLSGYASLAGNNTFTGNNTFSGNVNFPTATTSASGSVELATDAETQTGTDTSRAVVPSALAAWWAWVKTEAQTIAGNWTFNGILTAPNQTAGSGSNLMTRDLGDARWGFNRILGSAEIGQFQASGTTVTVLGGAPSVGSVLDAQLLLIPDSTSVTFRIPVGYRVSGNVRVISYWTDRGLSGSAGNVLVRAIPCTVKPTTNSSTQNLTNGTTVNATFSAAYTGTARFYVVDQTIDFGSVSGIDSTDPLQIKAITFSRPGADALDTSTLGIYLTLIRIIQL